MKVLIAEDDPISRTVLTRVLQKWGYEVAAAENGAQAWSLFEAQEFSVVISDWMMPEMDGLDLVRRIRGAGRNGYVYTILLTGKSQKENVVAGMEAGADDFVTKPFDPGELNARLRAGLRILSLECNLARRNEELEAVNQRMRRDLQTAAHIQKSLLPQHLAELPELKFAWAFRPCDELAGDILNIVRLDERHFGLYVLDVSSHGVPAALLAVTLSRLLTPQIQQSRLLKETAADGNGYRLVAPAEVGRQLSRQFPMDAASGQYFTLLYGVLDIDRLEFNYLQAGHPGPIHCSASNGCRVLEGFGLPIGFAEDVTYGEFQVCLSKQDRLLLYSDGAPEACNPDGDQFGEQRLVEAFEQARALPLRESLSFVETQLTEWCGDCGLKDDVSLLALEVAV